MWGWDADGPLLAFQNQPFNLRTLPTTQRQDAPTPSDDAEASAARSSELARLFDSLLDRMRVVKPAAFFALGTDGRQGAAMLEWLALQVGWGHGGQVGVVGLISCCFRRL